MRHLFAVRIGDGEATLVLARRRSDVIRLPSRCDPGRALRCKGAALDKVGLAAFEIREAHVRSIAFRIRAPR
jgi:hypothetical protein